MNGLIVFILGVLLLTAVCVWLSTLPEVRQYQEAHKDDPSSMNCGIGWSKHPFMECYRNGTIAR